MILYTFALGTNSKFSLHTLLFFYVFNIKYRNLVPVHTIIYTNNNETIVNVFVLLNTCILLNNEIYFVECSQKVKHEKG